jgi:hypothetical protein
MYLYIVQLNKCTLFIICLENATVSIKKKYQGTVAVFEKRP